MAKSQLDPTPQPDGILRRLRRYFRDQKGIAAMEFALVAPIMIGLYFMLNETVSGLRAASKTTMVARVMADLASRPANLTDAELTDIFNSAKPILSPFSTLPGSYRISSIRFDNTGKGYVDWSKVSGSGALGSAHARCTPITVPADLTRPNQSTILAEALVEYKPVVGQNIIKEAIYLRDKLYMVPRVAINVTLNGVVNVCP